MTTICTLLKDSQLPDSPSARLDTELLLAAAMGKPRSFLRTWPERIVPREANERFDDWIARRRNGEPVAYILGHQGFWSLDLEVAPHTLIPRPDTELLVETALATLAADTATVLDLGTGTGAIALALVAGSDGLDDIRQIVAQAPRHLLDEGWLLLEHGYDQGAAVRELLGARGFAGVHTLRDLGGNERITLGQWAC